MSLLFLFACLPEVEGPATTADPTDSPTAEPTPPPTPEPTPLPTSITVTSDGGELVFADGIVLDVPAGAVADEVTLSVTLTEEPVPAPYVGLSPLYRFEPAGQVFETPITVHLPFEGDDAEARAYWSNGHDGYLQPAGTLVENGVASLTVEHFSTGFVALNGIVEEPTQTAAPEAVDVLLVVDDSCSMSEEQSALATGAQPLFDVLGVYGIDYHLGVTTTDTDNASTSGRLRRTSYNGNNVRFLQPGDPLEPFETLVLAGTSGSIEEKGRDAAYELLETNRTLPRNNGFYRDDADLHLLFISDENDQSNATTLGDFRSWLETLKTGGERVGAHAITGLPSPTCDAVFEAGENYIRYANWTGGRTFNLCYTNWTNHMEAFGFSIVSTDTFYLLHTPDIPTIVVEAFDSTGAEIVLEMDDWVYDETLQAVVFTTPFAPEEQVFVRYTPEP